MPARQSPLLPLILAAKALATPVALGVNAIVDDAEGRVLLVRQRYSPGWHFPGGGVGRGEPPAEAIVRELREEVGLRSCSTPVLHGLYTRTVGIATNLVALYRVANAQIAFAPNIEIVGIQWCDPRSPPDNASPGTTRRLAELTGGSAASPYW